MKHIDGYEGLYYVSECGEVYSFRAKRNLKPIKQKTGYFTVGLYDKFGKQKILMIHRLVARAFIPNPENLPMVNHKDMNKLNNNLENLEWITAKGNIQHATNNGIRCGELNGMCKLTSLQVEEIRRKYSFRKYTHKMLGKEYGVGHTYIERILNGTARRLK